MVEGLRVMIVLVDCKMMRRRDFIYLVNPASFMCTPSEMNVSMDEARPWLN